MYRQILLAILLFCLGCTTPIEDLSEYGFDIKVDEVLRTHFTAAAYEVIKDIPMVDGFTSFGGGYAAGTNFWSTFASITTFNGYGRKVIFDIDKLVALALDSHIPDEVYIQRAIIHEYIHHLDDIGRDGGEVLIDLNEFASGFMACYGHQQYHGIYLVVESQSSRMFMNTFGIGDLGEHIAYTADMISFQGCPDELGYAYRRVLCRYQDMEEE